MKSPGRGFPGNYGFSDAGLFTINVKDILARCASGTTLNCWNVPQTNTTVYAKTANGLLEGSIDYM